MMDKYRIIEAFGIEVIPSMRIEAEAVAVEGHPVVLIRPDLTPAEHEEVLDELLAGLPDHVRSSLSL
ncbi:MAG TPA: hypothetical protein VK053_22060 [Jiangellaceae bacterium]|nr:hypothetical protein [Jiangellaceae bacterium]